MTALSPCTTCRRHVRLDEACPFCGGAAGPARRLELGGRRSRGQAATLAGVGLAVALDASACGAYGGPPPRASSPTSASFAIDERPDDLAARGKARGCATEPYGATLVLHCPAGELTVQPRQVSCPDLVDVGACRALYEQIAK